MAIKIKLSNKRNISFNFESESKTDYLSIDMSAIVEDSTVKEVLLHKDAIEAITTWVNESLENKIVPEVAGFLLGASDLIKEDASNRLYKIFIRYFSPSTKVDFSSPNKIVFGSDALLELDDFQQKHLDLKLVGWFHTHPGHSPFLSTTDAMIHEGFFNKQDEIAIVLDSKTSEFDTGFFTRKHSGEVNNQRDLIDYIYWKDIQGWVDKTFKDID